MHCHQILGSGLFQLGPGVRGVGSPACSGGGGGGLTPPTFNILMTSNCLVFSNPQCPLWDIIRAVPAGVTLNPNFATWVLLYLMPQLWPSVPVKSAQLSPLDVLEAVEITGDGL